jgi:hypothetical protein
MGFFSFLLNLQYCLSIICRQTSSLHFGVMADKSYYSTKHPQTQRFSLTVHSWRCRGRVCPPYGFSSFHRPFHKAFQDRTFKEIMKGFEAFTAVMFQVEIFRVVTSCSIVVGYQRFGGRRCLHLQGEVL